jgi:hypothetical protein
MDLTEGSETSAKHNLSPIPHPAFKDGPDRGFRNVGKTICRRFHIQPLKMDLTEGFETSAKHNWSPIPHPAFEDGPDRGFRNVGKT